MRSTKIMIVEDNTTVAEDCRLYLENRSYQVTSIVASGEESIEKAAEERPDAVLMDIHLRDEMDGIEAAEQIYARFQIPVVFLSAYDDRKLLERAKRVGCFGYLLKPFEENEIHAMLEMVLYKAQAERALRKSEEKFRHLFERSPHGFALVKGNGEILHSNSAYANMLGHSQEDMSKLNWIELTPEKWRQQELTVQGRKLMENGHTDLYEKEYIHKDGQILPVEVQAFLLERGEDFDTSQIGAFVHDITERRKAESSQRKSQQHFQELAESISDTFIALDEFLMVTYWNRAAEELTGISTKEAVGESLYELFPEAAGTAAEKVYHQVLRTRRPMTFETEYHMGETDRFYEVSVNPFDGGLSILARNISSQHHALESLQNSEARLEAIMAAAPVAMIVLDSEWRVRQANLAATQLARRPLEGMIGLREGKAIRCLHSLDDPKGCGFGPFCETCPVRLIVLNTLETRQPNLNVEVTLPFRIHGKKQDMTLLISATPLNGLEENLVLFCARDITAQK